MAKPVRPVKPVKAVQKQAERDARGNLKVKQKVDKKIDQEHAKPGLTTGQRAADLVTVWVGSWKFIISLFIFMAIWMAINLYALFVGVWDPYPFILLNFILSCLAAIQAPIILMSQNRQLDKDRKSLEYDYAVNRKAEREVADMQKDLDEIKRLVRAISRK